MPPAAIVFDLIGVLVEPSWRELVPDPQGARWRELKTGLIDEAEFWPATAAATYRQVVGFRDDRLVLVDRLRGRGHPIHVASNFAAAWARALRQRPEAARFAEWFISGELGVAKPDPRFFAVLRARLGAAVFVDDQRENCEAAAAAGLRAIWAWPGRDLEAAIDAVLDPVL